MLAYRSWHLEVFMYVSFCKVQALIKQFSHTGVQRQNVARDAYSQLRQNYDFVHGKFYLFK